MSSDREQLTGSPASSLFWSKSYAGFVMDKVLLEAKAAVEECFRRRARTAGPLPVGRSMTEKEIDDLSERLGDGFGGKA